MKRLTILLIITLLLGGCSDIEDKADKAEGTTGEAPATEGYSPDIDDENTVDGEEFKTITAEEAIEMIEAGGIEIIDVRSEEGYSESHIPNAQNIPLKEMEENGIELDKNGTYLIVCKVGKTSEKASKLLAESGYKNIYNLSGGMDGWQGEVVN
ncbi:MAG TPA: rhodanese-like domain-containing protein [Bacillus bacterium]|nr:rhodanese-like domain-containing protein [Bacillus sp. (in: firmicutes)]